MILPTRAEILATALHGCMAHTLIFIALTPILKAASTNTNQNMLAISDAWVTARSYLCELTPPALLCRCSSRLRNRGTLKYNDLVLVLDLLRVLNELDVEM